MKDTTDGPRRTDARSAPMLISLQTGADLVGVCPKTLRPWAFDGPLTAYRVGPQLIQVDQDELLALVRPAAPEKEECAMEAGFDTRLEICSLPYPEAYTEPRGNLSTASVDVARAVTPR